MCRINLDVAAARSRRVFRWSRVKRNLAEWRRHARSRSELQGLSDRSLEDIDLSRCTADFEASKPFWMA